MMEGNPRHIQSEKGHPSHTHTRGVCVCELVVGIAHVKLLRPHLFSNQVHVVLTQKRRRQNASSKPTDETHSEYHHCSR